MLIAARDQNGRKIRNISIAKFTHHSFQVTPQVVDKLAFNSIKMNLRHPERSEGSPEAWLKSSRLEILHYVQDDVPGELPFQANIRVC